MRHKERQRDRQPERNDEVAQEREPDDDARHDDRHGDHEAHGLGPRQRVARHGVGGGNAEGQRRERAADGDEQGHGEALAEALDREDLEDPLERKSLRRKCQRVARREGGGDDDQERSDQEGKDKDQGQRPGGVAHHLVPRTAAIRRSRMFAAKLIAMRMSAITLAEAKSLATVTR